MTKRKRLQSRISGSFFGHLAMRSELMRTVVTAGHLPSQRAPCLLLFRPRVLKGLACLSALAKDIKEAEEA